MNFVDTMQVWHRPNTDLLLSATHPYWAMGLFWSTALRAPSSEVADLMVVRPMGGRKYRSTTTVQRCDVICLPTAYAHPDHSVLFLTAVTGLQLVMLDNNTTPDLVSVATANEGADL